MQIEDRYPALVPELRWTPSLERPGSFCVSGRLEALEAELDASAAWVVRGFDGTRTCGELAAKLSRDGLHLGAAGYVAALAEHLAELEIVELLEAPRGAPQEGGGSWLADVEAIRPLRHRCVGCGRSCQGHFVGPLDAPFLARLPALMASMAAAHPDLEGAAPLRDVELGARTIQALATRGEEHACIFLGDDGRCRIHTTLGYAAKPLICRMFPFTVTLTEVGLRAGLSPRCYHLHASWEDGPAGSVAEVTGIPAAELAAPMVRVVHEVDAAQAETQEARLPLNFLGRERALLEAVHRGGEAASLGALLGHARGVVLDEAPRPVDAGRFASALEAGLRRLGASMRSDSGARPVAPRAGSHDAEVLRLARWLEGHQARPFEEVPARWRPFGLHVLGQWLWVRDWTGMPSFSAGLFATLAGLVVATWFAEDHPAEEESFATALAVWMRVMGMRFEVGLLFEDGEEMRGLAERLG